MEEKTDQLEREGLAEPERDLRGTSKNGRLEVWGLTAWYLSLLMKALNIHPPK
jgi:hypothetical protein